MTNWDAAQQIEEERTPEVKIDRYSFYRGWLWGIKFHEFCRWFKREYWGDAIKQEARQNGNTPFPKEL